MTTSTFLVFLTFCFLQSLPQSQAKQTCNRGPRTPIEQFVAEIHSRTGGNITRDTPSEFIRLGNGLLGRALFPDTNLETPIAVRVAHVVSATMWHVVAACDKKALSFLGTKDAINPRLCAPRKRPVVMAHILHRVIGAEHAEQAANLQALFMALGVDVMETSGKISTPAGWARKQAARLVRHLTSDGWNSLGNAGRQDFRQPFGDASSYAPVNDPFRTPETLKKPLRWTPLIGPTSSLGRFSAQVHVTPHIGVTGKPIAMAPKKLFGRQADSPYESPDRNGNMTRQDFKKIKSGIDTVLRISRNLTVKKAFFAQWWDNKLFSASLFALYYGGLVSPERGLAYYRSALADGIAQHDALLLAWKEKRRHDLVRPTTMIRRVYKNARGRTIVRQEGVVKNVKLSQWESFVPVMPHSEFPSASAMLCSATMEQIQFFLKDSLKKGSRIPPFAIRRPGVPFVIRFNSLEAAARNCGQSRLWAGVHFPPSVDAGFKLAKGIGKAAYQHVKDLSEGRIPEYCDRCGKFW